MAKFMQIAGTLIICNLCMCLGIMFAWPSSTLRLFESANTTLHRPMTESELAMFGSLSSVGALIGTPIAGMTLDRFGRKNAAITGSLMGVLSWTLIAASNRVEVLLTAMFVSGLSGIVFLVVPVYVSEICEESIRGAMCSGSMIFYGVGVLMSYLLGGFLSYYTMIYVCLTLTALATTLLALMKESPTCFMIKGMEKEAALSLAFYRRRKPDSKKVQEELNVIRRSLNPEMDDLTPEDEKQLKPEKQSQEKLSTWQFISGSWLLGRSGSFDTSLSSKQSLIEFTLRKSSATRSAFYLTITLVTASIFQGLVVVQVYAIPLFEDAVPTMSPNLCSILLAVVAIVSGLVAAYLTELAGRRPLMIYATFACAASCLLLGTQLHLRWGPNWLIAVNIYFFTMVYSFGGGTVPFVLMAEVFVPEVKSFMSMLTIELAWLCNSIILFIFNPLLKAIGLGPVFYLFAGVSTLTAIYSIFYVPETKGLSIDAIQAKLTRKKKRTDVVY